jgi:hypothetical protein
MAEQAPSVLCRTAIQPTVRRHLTSPARAHLRDDPSPHDRNPPLSTKSRNHVGNCHRRVQCGVAIYVPIAMRRIVADDLGWLADHAATGRQTLRGSVRAWCVATVGAGPADPAEAKQLVEAGHRLVDDGLIDYAARRRRFSSLTAVEPSVVSGLSEETRRVNGAAALAADWASTCLHEPGALRKPVRPAPTNTRRPARSRRQQQPTIRSLYGFGGLPISPDVLARIGVIGGDASGDLRPPPAETGRLREPAAIPRPDPRLGPGRRGRPGRWHPCGSTSCGSR